MHAPGDHATPTLFTARLTLRAWRDDDRAAFAAMNADPEVMEFFPAPLTRQESDALIDRSIESFATRGFGWWAVEVTEQPGVIGMVGLSVADFPARFTPAVEVGWRLARPAWGHGYAAEAARASMALGFTRKDLDEIVSFTARANRRSQATMARIGMTRDPDGDFSHPRIDPQSPLAPHVLYRLTRGQWENPPTN